MLKRLAALQPELPVLILTAFATIDTAIEAIGAGDMAFPFLNGLAFWSAVPAVSFMLAVRS